MSQKTSFWNRFFGNTNIHKNNGRYGKKSLKLEQLEQRQLLSVSPTTAFSLHSNEEAAHVIYLDFDGNTTTNTIWNTSKGISSIETPAYSIDADEAFSDQELDNIQEIWAYTAEYFSSFDVDVTTDESAYTNNNGIRVAIGGSCTDWYSSSGGTAGVAYVSSFTYSSDTPAFVFSESWFDTPSSVADTIAHEVGHSLGLHHDSTATQEYYPGANGWSPIMGGGSGPVQQWSKGEYSGATNKEDDLYIITTKNGFSYRTDDYGNTTSKATTLTVNSYNEFSAEGIIEQNTDSDYFKVVLTNTSDLNIKMSPDVYNCSLDTKLMLYNASGTLLATSNPTDSLSSEISVNNLAAGTYYIRATNDGCGSYYSSYGSIGSYTLTGTVGSASKTVVTTKNDVVSATDGVLSLREALASAKAGDRIVFSTDVFSSGDVIQLNSELTIAAGVIIDASDLYDESTNTPGLTIKAAENCRHFTISGGTTSTPVTLQGLAMVDGYALDGNGGSIILAGVLNIKQCSFENNQAYSQNKYTYGGVIYGETASTQVNVQDSRFIGNSADYGSVITILAKLSTINFTSSVAEGNSSLVCGAFYANWSCASINVLNSVLAGNEGGAIDTYGTCNIQNSTIAGNTGAVALDLSNSYNTQTIENSIVAGNYNDSTPSDVLIAGNAEINYSLIGNAQGVALGTGCISGTKKSPANPGFTSFTPNTETWTKDDWKAWDLTLNPNTSVAINAGSNTKAIYAFNSKLSEETDVTGTNSRLTGATIDMGAYEQANLVEKLTGLTLSTDSPNQGEEIQAIPNPPYAQVTYKWYRSTSKTSGFTLIENATSSKFTPDASCLNQYLKCEVTDSDGTSYSKVTSNVVRHSEKSQFVGQSEIQVTATTDVTSQYDNKITLREAIAYAEELGIDTIVFDGGLASSTITLTQGELEVNAPITIDAEGLDITITTTSGRLFNVCGGTDSTPVELIGLNLTGGNTTTNGGAILAAGTLKLQSCNVYNNTTTACGGVVSATEAGTHIYIVDSTVTGNEASTAGVCYLSYSMCELNITSSLIAGNSAYSSGVFSSNWSCAVVTILNSAIIGNKATYTGVGSNYGQVLVYDSTIAGNTASYYTGGISFGSGRSTHKIENSIIAQNTCTNATTNDISAAGTVTVNYSLIGNGSVDNVVSGSGNVIGSSSSLKNPGFVSLSTVSPSNWTKNTWKNWDYSLKSTSAAKDTGSNSLAYTAFGVSSTTELAALQDVQGKTRLSGNTIDMGACEYSSTTALATPTLNTPTASGTSATVSWLSVANASEYQLEYRLSTDSEWTVKTTTGTSMTVTGLTAGKQYYFRVKAIGSGNYSDSTYSSQKSVTIPVPTDNIQRVYASNISATAGSEITVPVYYEAMDGEGNLTGLGLRIHYDSSVLTYNTVTDLLKTSRVGSIQDKVDTGNQDGDASTDRVLVVSWSDADGEWPGSAKELLMNLKFTVNENASGSTNIRFTASSKAQGYTFQGDAAKISIVEGNFDIDGNGVVDLLTDGLLVNRYLSEYTGESLTKMAVGDGATRTDADAITEYLESIRSLLDIDGNGEVDLLTDGLLLNRYLSEYTGESLTKMAIGDGATRTTADEISGYIATLLPSAQADAAVVSVPSHNSVTDSIFDDWNDDDWDFNPVAKATLIQK